MKDISTRTGIALLAGAIVAYPIGAAQIALPNPSFESGPTSGVQALPVGSVLDGGWIVIQGTAAKWGCERRRISVPNQCMSPNASVAHSGQFGVLLGSTNQGGMTQSGIELRVLGLDDSRLYESHVWVRSEGGANGIELSCGDSSYVVGNSDMWVERACRGHSSQGHLLLRMRAVTFTNGNNSCWAPIVDDISLWDLGPDCNHNFVPDDIEPDCNANAIPDSCDITNETSTDYGHDGIPDECQCFADLNGSHAVDGADIGIILAFWGPTSPTFPMSDINRDGQVNGADLGLLLANWGPCPN
jgi:hypothetical protein